MRKLEIPKSMTETEEAEWWDSHMDEVEENLLDAIEKGTSRLGTTRLVNEAFPPHKALLSRK